MIRLYCPDLQKYTITLPSWLLKVERLLGGSYLSDQLSELLQVVPTPEKVTLCSLAACSV